MLLELDRLWRARVEFRDSLTGPGEEGLQLDVYWAERQEQSRLALLYEDRWHKARVAVFQAMCEHPDWIFEVATNNQRGIFVNNAEDVLAVLGRFEAWERGEDGGIEGPMEGEALEQWRETMRERVPERVTPIKVGVEGGALQGW